MIANRFRGLLPIVVDLETSGINPETDGLLEIAMVTIAMNKEEKLYKDKLYAYHIDPFPGALFNPESLAITGLDPGYPLRFAIPEQQVLHNIFFKIKKLLAESRCQRAVLVGHNAWFDLVFLQAAAKRSGMTKSNPFHSFTTFDTATMSALAFGETVLAKACKKAGIPFDVNYAHSAIYDAERTAELFCYIVNK